MSGMMSQLAIKPAEDALYGALFTAMDTGGAGAITPQQLAQLFNYTSLDKTVKSAIWQVASRGGQDAALSKNAFYVACRLVALAQSGATSLTREVLFQYTDVPLPQFVGLERYYPQATASAAPAAAPAAAGYGYAGYGYGGAAATASAAPSGYGYAEAAPAAAASSKKSIWEVSGPEYQYYLTFFSQADANGDGFVNGKEFKEYFTQLKVSDATQRDLWILADTDYDNKLKKNEFVIAMHLVNLMKNNRERLPSSLPAELKAIIKADPAKFGKDEEKAAAPAATPAAAPAAAPATAQPAALMMASVDTSMPQMARAPSSNAYGAAMSAAYGMDASYGTAAPPAMNRAPSSTQPLPNPAAPAARPVSSGYDMSLMGGATQPTYNRAPAYVSPLDAVADKKREQEQIDLLKIQIDGSVKELAEIRKMESDVISHYVVC
jgi:hypothetical protein